ncbi:MAG: transcription termination/antitermination protein NusG [Candidatus Algichlamydia australiensis]|nr:transcription termination/antitermination protein NusG [Chlamydiales bacterium]
MNQWYVVQVMSGHEKKVKRALEENREQSGMLDLIEEVLLPIENVAEVKGGQQTVVEKRLWPGYLLLRMNLTDDVWLYIKNTNGVIGFLGGGKPTPLSQVEVDNILEELKSRKDEVVQKHKLEVGDVVKITDGVFVNFTGEVLEVHPDKGRVSVLVSIFGRETRVDDLEFWQVELNTENK